MPLLNKHSVSKTKNQTETNTKEQNKGTLPLTFAWYITAGKYFQHITASTLKLGLCDSHSGGTT